MIRFTFLALLVVSFFQINATHIKGGEIYYSNLGNNNYEFTLTLYRDITGINMPGSQSITLSGSTIGTINLSLSQDTFYAFSSCAVGLEAYVYKGTSTISVIPNTGITAKWESCCRNTAINNLVNPGAQAFTIQAELYPVPGATFASSSARFFGAPTFAFSGTNNVLNTGVFDPNFQDSVHVELINVMGNNGAALAYAIGFSATQPFGTSVATSIDALTGVLTVNNPNLGGHAVGIKASSFRNGQLMGSSMRDLPVFVTAQQDSMPSIIISNLTSSGTATITGNTMYVDMQAYDSLGFVITGLVNSLDNLSLSGTSTLFGNTLGTSGNCSGSNCASLTSGSFSSNTAVSGNFSFAPDSSIFMGGSTQITRVVNLEISRIATCGGTFITPFTVYITVNQVGSIWVSQQPSVCAGDSVQGNILGDNGNVVWSPTTGVSNPNSASPWLSPANTTTYTVTNLNDSTQISVIATVSNLTAASLVDNSTWAYLPNLADYDLAVWYYNGIALSANVDSFAMPLPGHYYVYLESGACMGYSDTIIKVNKNQLPAFDPSAGTTVNTDGNATMTFELLGYNNTLTSLTLAAPDETVFKTTQAPSITILDDNQTVLATGMATPLSNGFYQLDSLNLSLAPSTPYHIEVTMQAGTTIFNKPSSLPYTENEGVIKITAASYLDKGTLMNDAFPNFTFGLVNGIGLEEETLASTLVYPNPAQNELRFKTDKTGTFTLMDASGKKILNAEINSDATVDISDLPRGLYVYVIESDSEIKNGKLILQ